MNKADENTGHQFGTFGGVFTPSILTILGVIMFMRANFVVGQAGIRGALTVLLIAKVISLLTALSLSAVSTNTPVKAGGVYYIISRVLGPEFGGAIGLTLYLAQALSVPFYILGFTESVVSSFPVLQPHFFSIALLTVAMLFALNFFGAQWAIRSQYVVMTILALSIIVFLVGGILQFSTARFIENWKPAYTAGNNFWIIFAIYFPAVTGSMAVVNMSGDLRDPAKSLVRGVFSAILVAFAIYAAQMLIYGGAAARADLIGQPYQILILNAFLGAGQLVIAGVFAATLSSAVGSFMGAPRIIQALSHDRILPGMHFFAKGSGTANEPRRALLLTFAISLVVVALAADASDGQAFNLVASIVTMFFLSTYGMVNLAAFVESFGRNPSFRPRFRFFSWWSSLIGALTCIIAMYMISPLAATLAVVIIAIIYGRIKRLYLNAAYGDSRRGLLFSVVSKCLLALSRHPPHPKNWRPSFLLLAAKTDYRLTLVKYANWLAAERGIIALAEIIEGSVRELVRERQEALDELNNFIAREKLLVYPEVIVTRDLDDGIRVLLQAQSIGPLKPNTVLMGWPRDAERLAPFVRHIQNIRALGKSVACIQDRGLPDKLQAPGQIDIWWRGKANGALMLLLAYLLTQHREWHGTAIRILRIVRDEAGRIPAHEALTQLALDARIDVGIQIVVSENPFREIIEHHSRNAAVVFMGFAPPRTEEEIQPFFASNRPFRDHFPTTIHVCSNREADLLA